MLTAIRFVLQDSAVASASSGTHNRYSEGSSLNHVSRKPGNSCSFMGRLSPDHLYGSWSMYSVSW